MCRSLINKVGDLFCCSFSNNNADLPSKNVGGHLPAYLHVHRQLRAEGAVAVGRGTWIDKINDAGSRGCHQRSPPLI